MSTAQRLEHSTASLAPPPVGAEPVIVDAETMLMLEEPKRMVVQRRRLGDGGEELCLYYGAKEVSFDDPGLFAFGDGLARQTRFKAVDATNWGPGYDWRTVRDLLQALLDDEILVIAPVAGPAGPSDPSRDRPSPLPPARSDVPRTWRDCETVTADLTGIVVEAGWLELIVPVFRVAHPVLDADGRQVGEANVFPRALRLDTPTEWLTSIYPGTRYRSEKPMNVTALKAMRQHWPQVMAVLGRIRQAYLDRFPQARAGWTTGHVERLASLTLAVATYPLMRADDPVGNGELHPALASLFRVTDGLRLTLHQMLFIPIGEPTLPADAPITAVSILDYAERNHVFHSETGVCAGPRLMVQEFLAVLLDGRTSSGAAAAIIDPPVERALTEIPSAFAYGLHGLRAHAALFSLWPEMARCYERLAGVVAEAVKAGHGRLAPLNARLDVCLTRLRTGTYLADERWRTARDEVYADMYDQCGRGLAEEHSGAGLRARLAPIEPPGLAEAEHGLQAILETHLATGLHAGAIRACLIDFAVRMQAVLRTACDSQSQINHLLGRAAPKRPFSSRDLIVHNRLLGDDPRRLPYLPDEIETALGIGLFVTPDTVSFTHRHPRDAMSAPSFSPSSGIPPVEPRASIAHPRREP